MALPLVRLTRLDIGSRLNIWLAAAVVVVVTGGCAASQSVAPPSATPAPCPPASSQSPLPTVDEHSAAAKYGWRLTHHDEFTGTCLDLARWGVYDGPGSGGVGLRRPSAISVGDGELRITARGMVSGGLAWVGPATTYGRWEVRMKADRGTGYSAVVLLWPDSDRWPVDGELDFAEISAPNRDRNNFTAHWGIDNSQSSASLVGDFSQWHDYAVEWEPDHVTMFVDGLPIYHTTDPAAIPRAPMHLALQQDVLGGDHGSSVPSVNNPDEVTMHVDWVRMYSR